MKKKIILLTIALLSSFSLTVQAFVVDGLTYSISNGAAQLTTANKTGASGDIVIPATVVDDNGTTYKVTTIVASAFYENTNITSLDLSGATNLTSIGNTAFYGCSALRGNLVIPENVTSIGNSAFAVCGLDGTLTFLGNKITTIGEYAFSNSNFTGPLTIPESVTTISKHAFRNCDFTGDLIIPNSVTTLGESAFIGTGFTGTLTIGTGIKTINRSTFSGCTCTGDLTIPENVTTISGSAFSECYGFSGTLTIANSVTSMGTYVFQLCSGFNTLILGNGLTTINSNVFKGCYNLSKIYVTAPTIPTVYENSFLNVPTTATLIVPCDQVETYRTTDIWKNFTDIRESEFTLTLQTASEAQGSVEMLVRPCENIEGRAEFQAVAGRSYEFDHWSDGNTDNPRSLVLTENTTLTAYFAPKECTETVTTNRNISELDCLYDIIVANGATLTVDETTTLKNLTIQEGATLHVANGATLTIMDALTAQSEDDVQPQILTEGTGAITYGDFYFVKKIPADRYYFFSLPFASNTSTVTINDEKTDEAKSAVYNTDWNYLYYDGAAFAQNPSNESFWYTANAGTINPNQGYAVGVDASSPEAYRELTFTASGTVDFGINGTRTVAVSENPLRANYAHPDKETFKGWNFILNPYTSNFTGTMTLPGISDADVYVSIPKAGQNQTYTQCRLSDLTASGWGAIPPFYGFFVQVGKSGNVTFSPKAKSGAPRKAQAAQPYSAIGVTLSNGTAADITTLVIGEQYTDNYEIGSDLQKMIGYSTEPQVYLCNGATKYAYKSVNETSAAQAQPMGVYLPAAGTYTFSLRDSETAAQTVYLYDYETNTTTNLVESDYTFTCGKLNSEKRFAISATLAPKATTALPTDATTRFSVYQEGTHITLQGVAAGDTIRIINVQGQVVAQWTATDSTLTGTLPHRGLYIIERTSTTTTEVNKIIIQ